jgi:DNA-binding response OmpR family regulator
MTVSKKGSLRLVNYALKRPLFLDRDCIGRVRICYILIRMYRKKILIIEDDKLICDSLVRQIRNWGFKAIKAYDGADGLAKAQLQKPDLILLDLGLPKLPGEEVCRQIRKSDSTKEIPIIMETGKVSDTDKVIGRVIGADYYLRKPYTFQELRDKINKLL